MIDGKTIVTTYTSSNLPLTLTAERRAHHYLDMLTCGPEHQATLNFCLDNCEEALDEWIKVANCGRRRSLPFEEFFPNDAIMSYRDHLGQLLPGYVYMPNADGRFTWRMVSPDAPYITVDERADYIREYLQPRFLGWLVDAFITFVISEKCRQDEDEARNSDWLYNLFNGRSQAAGAEEMAGPLQVLSGRNRIGRTGRVLSLDEGGDYAVVVTRPSER